MNDADKARVLDLFEDDEMTEFAARELLGDEAFDDAMERARGVNVMLSGDVGRFMTNDGS